MITRANIITKVLAALDELSTITTDNPYTDLVDSVLDDAAVYVNKTAPIHLLLSSTLVTTSLAAFRINYATFDLPADYVRLIDLYHTDFERPITVVTPETKEFWGKYTRPNKAKPQLIIYNMTFVLAPAVASTLDGNYIQSQIPLVSMIDTAVPAVVYKAAMEVMTIVQDFNGAKAAAELLMNFYQTNLT